MKQNKMNINKTNPAIQIAIVFPLLALMAWGCGSTDSNRPIPWERPESPWRFQALLNEEPVEVEIDTAWIHPGNGIYFIVRLSTPSPFDQSYYNSQFSIMPAIRSIPLDSILVINDIDRLDKFEQLSFHSIISESVIDDVTMTTYRLNPEDTTNYVRFTKLEVDEGERYRAIIAGEYEAVYYCDPEWVDTPKGSFRQLPDTVRITHGRFETVLLDWDDYDYWKEQY